MLKRNKTNTCGWLALALPAFLPFGALAEPLVLQAPSAAPATEPAVVSVPVPAVTEPSVTSVPAPAVVAVPVPATTPVAPQTVGDKVLVLPFQAVNVGEINPWVGKSIQQSLVADLMVSAPDRVVTADQFAATLDAAVALGRQAGARYVVAGGFVTMDHDLRITGQLLDVETGKAIAGLKVTGNPNQIFHMEDGLAMQIKARLFGQTQPMPNQVDSQPSQPQAQVQVPAPNSTGLRNDAGNNLAQPVQVPTYSSYASVPAPTAYGSDYSAYTYYPSGTGYTYSYPAYTDYGYDPYYYGGYGYPFGVGLGFYYGNGNYRYGRDEHHRDFGGRSGFNGRSGGGVRGSIGVTTGGGFHSDMVRGGSSFRSSSSIGSSGGFHSGFSGSHSFGGGGFHGGGGGHGGGGHR